MFKFVETGPSRDRSKFRHVETGLRPVSTGIVST
jgi:hypothetical protein